MTKEKMSAIGGSAYGGKNKKKFLALIYAYALVAFLPLISKADGWDIVDLEVFNLPGGTIYGIIENILYWILGIFGFVGIIGFVISGLMYILAAGDEKTMETAKNAMKWSIIGVVVGLAGFVAIQAIDAMLGAGDMGDI